MHLALLWSILSNVPSQLIHEQSTNYVITLTLTVLAILSKLIVSVRILNCVLPTWPWLCHLSTGHLGPCIGSWWSKLNWVDLSELASLIWSNLSNVAPKQKPLNCATSITKYGIRYINLVLNILLQQQLYVHCSSLSPGRIYTNWCVIQTQE